MREVLCLKSISCIVISSVGCEDQPYSWVCREGRKRERRERDLQAKCIDRTVCFHLIYQETQFCGRIPRERVNHVYLVVLCD
jgi:hypothetical protein